MVEKDRSEYLKNYYAERRDELSEKRKAKYRSDPAARARAIEASRRYREEQRQKKKAMIERGEIEAPHRGPRAPVMVEVAGKQVEAFTITTFAEQIGRSAEAINHWINVGIIPKTPFRSDRGDRLYTDAMMLAVKLVIQRHGLVSRRSSAGEEIREKWKEIGVEIDG